MAKNFASNPTNITNYYTTNNNTLPMTVDDIYSNNQLCNIKNRNPFIRKVYTNLSIMWFFISTICYGFIYNEKMNMFANSTEASRLMIFAYIALFLSVLLPICFERLVKTSPSDYFILFIYTATEAYILGIVCARNNTQAVFLAAGTTLVITLAMTLFACQTKYDCTGSGGFLLTALSGIIAINIINIFVGSSTVNLWAACASVVLFSAYIVYDTQLIVGGSHKKYQFSTDDHVLATISIHLDMVNLFLNILQILTSSNSD
tara:strand:+ start:3547 stop:4329 length:783 start_codon:yes stop_codon:yes gene_type:complete